MKTKLIDAIDHNMRNFFDKTKGIQRQIIKLQKNPVKNRIAIEELQQELLYEIKKLNTFYNIFRKHLDQGKEVKKNESETQP